MRAVVYLRISLDRTGEGLGVERQEADARQLATVRGWEVADVITENSVSASGKHQRQGFERLLELVTSGEVQVIVAWSLDRLTRNRPDTVRLIETCQRYKVLIALVRGSDMDMATPAGRMVADILASVARSEIEVKSDRQTRAARQAAELGRHVRGRRPFGYEDDGVTPRATEAAAIRDAYQLILDGGSLREVARNWNAAGFRTPQNGNPWTGNVVTRTLRLPRMAGLRVYHKQVMRRPDGEPVRAEFPGIVDVETWQAARHIMNDPKRRPTQASQLLLTGVAVCGVCGAGIHAGGPRRGDRHYRCANGGGHVNRRAKPLEDFVVQAILYRLARPDAADLFAAATEDQTQTEVREKLRRTQQIFDSLPDLLAEGELTPDEFKAQRGKLRTKIAELTEQMPTGGRRPRAVRSLVTSDDIEGAWDVLTTEDQRDVIHALATITLYPVGRGVKIVKPEHVVIKWK